MDKSARTVGSYRYTLKRIWGDGPLLMFVMLNPSTANSLQDDPTIRRCMRFAQDLGYGGIVVENLYAWRATRPAELAEAVLPVGVDNDASIARSAFCAGMVVVAWGSSPWARRGERVENVRRVLRDTGHATLWCLGKTLDGSPRHPLYVRADKELEQWP